MAQKRASKERDTATLAKARDELYNHILRCGVLQATVEHQKEWFDDTIEYMAERYPSLSEEDVHELRRLGERYCQPVINNSPAVGATT